MSRLGFLQDLLASVLARGGTETISLGAADPLAHESFETLCEALLSERGEVSGHLLGRAILVRFTAADDDQRRDFFTLLAERYDIDPAQCQAAARRYAATPDARNLEHLADSVEPRRQELLRRLNRVPGATHALVTMRESLFEHQRKIPALARVDVDFRHLFRSWFNPGFLALREIDWNTPANVLEKIIAYEAVHAIRSWEALRERVQPSDRRCFAFFHPAMPDEPLIFVEVALTRGTPDSVREVLAEDRVRIEDIDAGTAIFYSISNCQRGLAGVSFGNFLIKQVVAELRLQLPALEQFRTLSPVPGLMEWVAGTAAHDEDREALDLATEIATGERAEPDEQQRHALSRLVTRYLTRSVREDGQPIDPVARFHLGNGASLDRILPAGDHFDKGLKASAGTMVSYLYDLESIESNHERYAESSEVIVSGTVPALLEPVKRRSPVGASRAGAGRKPT